MDLDLLEKSFDAWSDLISKARKAKGLDNWTKLKDVASKLTGKQAKHITFTSSHPSYEGKPVKHTLGSTTGNLHFLLGYANPAFHLAPYHWQVIDPHLSDEDIKNRQHPSNPKFWAQSGLPLVDEGDFDEGQPHPSVKASKDSEARKAARKAEALPVTCGYGYYVCVPSEGIVFSADTGQIYKWEVVKDSFFAAVNPEVAEKMNEAAQPPEFETSDEEVEKSASTHGGFTSSEAKYIAEKLGIDFDKHDFSFNEFVHGVNEEIEHSDVVKKDPLKIGRIALEHLKEDKHYYTKLSRVMKKSYPEAITPFLRAGEFSSDVYPLVKSLFPAPGSMVPMGSSLWAVIEKSNISFYTPDGQPTRVRVFDRMYDSFDLTEDGNIHPSILMNFAVKYLGINKGDLSKYLVEEVLCKGVPPIVEGDPTPGFDDIPSEYNEVERTVVVLGNTARVVPRIG